jgi:hypothetical protein
VDAAPGSVLLGARAGELCVAAVRSPAPGNSGARGSRIVRMQRKDVPSAATEDKVGIGLRLNGQLLVSVCPCLQARRQRRRFLRGVRNVSLNPKP